MCPFQPRQGPLHLPRHVHREAGQVTIIDESSPIKARATGTTGMILAKFQAANTHTSATYAEKTIQCTGTLRAHRLYRGSRRDFPSTYPLSNVNIAALEKLCKNHPDKNLVKYISNGLYFGFDIGFRGYNHPTRPKNLLSAKDNAEGLSIAIAKELERGHTAGPFLVPPWDDLHCSPVGAVPKKDGSCRIILDLSQPKGMSINEGIDKEEFIVQYTHFDRAIELVRDAGQGCFMSKADVKHAFRLLPVRPEDWKLLGFKFDELYFVDVRLSFGSRSSPGIFNDFADLICWILQYVKNLPRTIHYSDDFFLVSDNHWQRASADLMRLRDTFSEINTPLAAEKLFGPLTCITFLGIEINSKDMCMSIPDEKFQELIVLLPSWKEKRKCTKRELLSLIGVLGYASKVVQPGRMFVRRLIDLSTTVEKYHYHIYLNSEARADIQWWIDFLPYLRKRSFIPESKKTLSTDFFLFTDASFLGLGAIFQNEWIQYKWPPYDSKDVSIDFFELFAVVAAVLTWGHRWPGKRIVIVTDNKPITQIWHSGTSPSPRLMVLVRRLFFFAGEIGFTLTFKHIPGSTNEIADAISRFQDERFRRLAPEADKTPSNLPNEVFDLLKVALQTRSKN